MPKKSITTSRSNRSQLSARTWKKRKKKERLKLLSSLELKEFFADGSITINERTCHGIECRLCIKVCPTNALFWRAGEVGIIEDLCIYCGACVLSCIVDDCIKIVRERSTGEVEVFSKPKDFATLQHSINAKRRFDRTRDVFPKPEDYVKRYSTKRKAES